jgi:hypothetical protein
MAEEVGGSGLPGPNLWWPYCRTPIGWYDTPGTWSAGYLFRDSAADHIWALNPRGPIDYVLVEGSITIFRALFAAWYPDRVPPLGPTAEEVFYNQRCRVIHV